jgi:hypothetical protein
MRGWRVTVAALAACLVVCGDAGDLGQERPGAIEDSEVGERVVEALCARDERCGVYASTEACERDLRRWGWGGMWLGLGTRHDAALASGRLSYDEDAAERCVATLRDSDCRLPALTFLARQRGIEYEPACQVLRVEEPASTCRLHAECGGEAYCHFPGDGTPEGTCQPRSVEGEVALHPIQCAPGLVLAEPGGRCQRPAEEGEVCYLPGGAGITHPCGPGLWCDQNGGTCQRARAEGDACGAFGTPPCDESLVCKEGHCGRRSRPGESCRATPVLSTLYRNDCQEELFCDAERGELGTCREQLGEGVACRESFECAGALKCVGPEQAPDGPGFCQEEPGLGAPCARSEYPFSGCAKGLVCFEESGRCVPYVPEGERCGPEALCATGPCVNGRCAPYEARSASLPP